MKDFLQRLRFCYRFHLRPSRWLVMGEILQRFLWSLFWLVYCPVWFVCRLVSFAIVPIYFAVFRRDEVEELRKLFPRR
jgi:hypothetical protein